MNQSAWRMCSHSLPLETWKQRASGLSHVSRGPCSSGPLFSWAEAWPVWKDDAIRSRLKKWRAGSAVRLLLRTLIIWSHRVPFRKDPREAPSWVSTGRGGFLLNHLLSFCLLFTLLSSLPPFLCSFFPFPSFSPFLPSFLVLPSWRHYNCETN